jgi:phage terminase small subunit
VGNKKLTPFELDVCQAYFENGGNKSEAFRTCHKTAAGWKESTVWARASKVFAQEHIKKYVAELHHRARVVAAEKFDITAEKVLNEIAKIAFADIRRLFDGNRILLPGEIPDDIAAAISSIEVVTSSPPGDTGFVEYTHKFKLSSKLQALGFLAEYLNVGKAAGNKQAETEDFCGAKIPAWMKELIPSKTDLNGDSSMRL